MRRATGPWVRKAENDFQVAQEIANTGKGYHDALCFFCQQSAEKYLKALLVQKGETPPHTHDLEGLWGLLLTDQRSLKSLRRGLLFLNGFAVETRYPGMNASKRQAASALRWAGRVRHEVRAPLGLDS